MKRYIILLLTAVLICSCSNRFEEYYPELKLSRNSYLLDSAGGTFQFMVYYSSTWNCSLETDAGDGEWLVLSRDGASGQAYIRVTYESSASSPRTASIVIKADNGDTETVILNQKAK